MTKSPRRKRPALNKDLIATEAMALVDEGGLDALSFRALGKRMGCEAMSLYHYFPSKQHLLDALVSICLAETPVPPPGQPWRDRMRTLCLRYRETAIRHAAFAPVLFTHRLNHAEGLAWLDRVVGIFDGSDLPHSRRAALFRVLSYYLTGASLDESLGYAKGPSAAEPVPLEDAKRDFPHIMGVGAHFGRENHLAFFEEGLDLILDWIEREI
ncbi:MAG: TetR/AcrR family transcriptional regulator C-terminal domain-containing protein [Silicimonas sp.]|jgi:AcrR family transcriptional regulator|nr:TetR/AcrR family transcriptional regulator C-terminal domain-containing protein [Silicimonas sp.]